MSNPFGLPTAELPPPQLTYRQVLDLYDDDRKNNPVFSQMTLPEYAQTLNRMTNSPGFADAGATTGFGGLVKRADAGLNRVIEATGLPEGVGNIMGGIVGAVDPTENHWLTDRARQVGESLPRTAVNIAPIMASGGLPGILGTGALSAAGTYEDTGSKGLALLSGATAGLIPQVFKAGGNFAARAAGADLVDATGHVVGDTLGQRLAGYAGSQAAGLALMEVSHQAGHLATQHSLDLSKEHFADTLLGQIPFLGLDLPRLTRGGEIAQTLRNEQVTNWRAFEADQHAEFTRATDEWLAKNESGLQIVPYVAPERGFTFPGATERPEREFPIRPQGRGPLVPYDPTYAPSAFSDYPLPGESRVGTLFGQRLDVLSTDDVDSITYPSGWRRTRPSPLEGSIWPVREPVGLLGGREEPLLLEDRAAPLSSADLLGKQERVITPSTPTPNSDVIIIRPEPTPAPERQLALPEPKPGEPASEPVEQIESAPVQPSPESVARQQADLAYDESQVRKPPVPPQVVEEVIKPLLTEQDAQTAIARIRDTYELILKPKYGVYDVALERLSDSELTKSITLHLNEGKTFAEAVQLTTLGIKNTLVEASAKPRARVFDSEAQRLLKEFLRPSDSLGTTGGDLAKKGVALFRLGLHLAKNIISNGVLNLAEWRQELLSRVGDIDPALMSGIERAVVRHLHEERSQAEAEAENDTVSQDQSAAANLGTLDTAWNKLSASEKGGQKSPTERFAIWRNEILDRNPHYEKYAEVDRKMLLAGGALSHDGLNWRDGDRVLTDTQAKAFVQNAAEYAYKAATKKESGGTEPAFEHVPDESGKYIKKALTGFTDANTARAKADELNALLVKDAGFTYEVETRDAGNKKSGASQETYNIVKRNQTRETLVEGSSGAGSHRATLSDLAHDPTTAHETDTLSDIERVSSSVEKASDRVSSDVIRQHLYDIFEKVLIRLDPYDPSVTKFGKNKLPELVARTHLMLDFMKHEELSSLDGAGVVWAKFVEFANSQLHESFRFTGTDNTTASKEANNWWNGRNGAREFFTQWASEQPELAAMAQKGSRSYLVASTEEAREREFVDHPETTKINPFAPDVQRAVQRETTGAREPWWKTSHAMTGTDFLRGFFQRMGLSPEMAQRSTDATQRIGRAVAFFKGGERAGVEFSDLPDNVAGQAVSRFFGGVWAPIVKLNRNISSEGFLTMVAGHESFETLLHGIETGETKGESASAVMNLIEHASTMTEGERLEMLEFSLSQLPESIRAGMDPEMIRGLFDYSAKDPKEFVATLAGLHVLASTEGKGRFESFLDSLKYGDGMVSRVVMAVIKGGQSLVNAYRGLSAANDQGMISDVESPQGKALSHFSRVFELVSNTEKEVKNAVGVLTRLDSMGSASVVDSIKNGTTPELELTGDPEVDGALKVANALINKMGDPEEIGKVKGAWWDPIQLSEAHPILKPVIGVMLAARAMSRTGARDMASAIFEFDHVRGEYKLGKASEPVQRVMKSERLSTALGERLIKEQELERSFTDQELRDQQRTHGLSPGDVADLSRARQALQQINQTGATRILQFVKGQFAHTIGHTIMHGGDVTFANGVAATERLVAIRGLLDAPQPGVDPAQLLASVTTQYGIAPEKVQSAMLSLNSLWPKFQKLEQTFSNKDYHVTLQRTARFQASYLEKQADGSQKPFRFEAKTREEMERKLAGVESDPRVSAVQRFDNSDKHFVGTNPTIVNSLIEIGQAAYERTAAVVGHDRASEARQGYTSFLDAINRELAAKGLGKFTQGRRLVAGSDPLLVVQNNLKYASSLPSTLSNLWLRERANLAMSDPAMLQNPSALRRSKILVDAVLAPTSPLVNAAKKWTFFWTLAGNVSSMVVEQLQPIQALPWQMVREGETIGGAARKVKQAYKDVTRAYIDGKIDDPFVNSVIKRLEEEGSLEQMTGYVFDHDDLNTINLSRATTGNLAIDYGRAALDRISHLPALARTMYSKSTAVSSRVTAFAAAARAKEMIARGELTPEGAYDYIRNLVHLTAPGTAGKVGKPAWMNDSALGVLSSLQGYTSTMYSMLHRLGVDAFNSKSMTSAETKAFLGMLATNFVLAGAAGLAGVGTIMNVVNAAAPNWRVKEKLREGVAALFGEDTDNGSTMTDLFMHGLPSVLTGVDFSSRLSLANMLGVSDYDGFKVSQLLGAPGSLAQNVLKGASQVVQGQFAEGMETAAPTALKNVLRVWNDGGDVSDSKGNLLHQSSPVETFAQLIGFTPRSVSKMKEFDRLSQQMERSRSSEQADFVSKMADLLKDNQLAAVRAGLLEREKQNPEEFNAAAGLKLVIRRMQDQTMPEDPRRGGSKMSMNDRADLLRTYGELGVSPSEQARLQQQQAIMSRFGLVGGIDSSAVRKAQLVDNLMATKNMTRQEARVEVDKMFKKQQRASLPSVGSF